MSPHNPSSTMLMLQALKAFQESKGHLKQALHEVLLATQSVVSSVSEVATVSDFEKNYPNLNRALRVGEGVLGELLERTQPEINPEPAHEEEKVKPHLVSHKSSRTFKKGAKR